MQKLIRSWLGILAMIAGQGISSVAAQPATACHVNQELLLHCHFDDGTKQVGLCLSGETIIYRFGSDLALPELELERDFEGSTFGPRIAATGTVFESVTLMNGNTSYEISTSSRRRIDRKAVTTGSITITLPNGTTQQLSCDPGSVTPPDPFQGIGKLTLLTDGSHLDPLSRCLRFLSESTGPEVCIGTIRDVEIADGTCDPNQDVTACWRTENAYWNELVKEAFEDAVLRLEGNYDATVGPKLEASQASWLVSQELDCAIEGRRPFAADGGTGECHAGYAAARLSFISSVVLFAEFEG